jgi:hypothetical protein
MSRKTPKAQIWTVRSEGQFLGTYRAISATQAIGRLVDEQRAYYSTFRGSIELTGLTAAVEVIA